jgi:integrase
VEFVDLKTRLITLPVGFTKNGDGREYAIEQVRGEITQALQWKRGMVIPSVFYRVTEKTVLPIKSHKTASVNACDKVALAGRRVHDFRRCAARSLRKSGVPESVYMSLLGHQSAGMFRRIQSWTIKT